MKPKVESKPVSLLKEARDSLKGIYEYIKLDSIAQAKKHYRERGEIFSYSADWINFQGILNWDPTAAIISRCLFDAPVQF